MKDRPKLQTPVVEESVSNPLEIEHLRVSLKIDSANLDQEVSEQSQTFLTVADRYAHARSLRDEAKDHLKTVEAEIYTDERVRLEEAGEKVTETMLASFVQRSKLRRKAFKRLVEMEREVLEWEGLKEAWRDRSFMLRELCSLTLASHFSDSSMKSGDLLKREVDATRNKMAMTAKRKERQNRG